MPKNSKSIIGVERESSDESCVTTLEASRSVGWVMVLGS